MSWPAQNGVATLERGALLVVGLGTLLASIDSTATNVSLETIARSLDSSLADVQWVTTGFLLAIASTIPLSGWAARRFGSRRVYIWSLVMFTASSALCAFSGSLWMLVACRVLQGAAAGMLSPLSQLIAAEVAGSERMARTMSRIWMISNLGLVAGPILGGLLVAGPGWRWIFLINIPIGTAATAAAVLLLPRRTSHATSRLDLAGLLRLSPGLLLLVFALAEGERTGSVASPTTLTLLLLGVVLVADFVRHALNRDEPLLDLRLYRRRTFAFGSFSLFFLSVSWFGMMIIVPLYLQQVQHLSPAAVGLLLAPQGLGTVAGLWRAGLIESQVQTRRLALIAIVAFIAAELAFSRIAPADPDWLIASALFVLGFSGGFAWVPATAAGYVDLSSEQVSHASALVAVVVRIGGSFGTAAAAIVLQYGLTSHAKAGEEGVLLAYRAGFLWPVLVGLVGLLMFAGLYRSEGPRLGGKEISEPSGAS